MFTGHRRAAQAAENMPSVTPETLSRLLGDFLGGSRHGTVLENGARLFDLADAHYSVSGEYNKCLLHVWSAERNVVRRILDAELRNGGLRLTVQKLGQSRPARLEICKGYDPRTPTARRAARSAYQGKLARALERNFPGFKVTRLSNAMDLERSFGPIYSRGLLRQARTAFAVLGVNQQETQGAIDAALSFAVLWLDACRHSEDPATVVEGLKLFLPPGSSDLTRERMAHLNPAAAKWQLYEFDERHDAVTALDPADAMPGRSRRSGALHRLPRPDSGSPSGMRDRGPVRRRSRFPLAGPGICPRPPRPTNRIFPRFSGNRFWNRRRGTGPRGVQCRRLRRAGRAPAGAACPARRQASRAVPPAPGTLARISGRARRDRPRPAARPGLRLLSGPRVLSIGPGHARRAHYHPRPPPGRRRTESGRRCPPAPAGPRLLVARAVAPCAGGIRQPRILRRAGTVAGRPPAVSGSAHTAHPSRH